MNDSLDPAGPKSAAGIPAKRDRVTNIGLTDAFRDQATGYVDRRKGEMARFISQIATALYGGSDRLDGAAQAKPFVEGVAGSLDALSQAIDEHGLGELYSDAKDATRRHPEAAMLMAAVAGFGAFHLLRASMTTPIPTPNRLRL